LDSANGKQHIQRSLAAFGIAQTCHAVVAGGKHQIFKLMGTSKNPLFPFLLF
jgi:hypothetical protein